MDLIPYLLVNNAKTAITFYQEMLNAQLIEHHPFTLEIGKTMHFPDDYPYEQSTMHAILKIEKYLLYLADNTQQTNDYGHVELTLELDTDHQIHEIYEYAKSHQCKLLMPITNMPGLIYARLTDPFGVTWQLNYIPNK